MSPGCLPPITARTNRLLTLGLLAALALLPAGARCDSPAPPSAASGETPDLAWVRRLEADRIGTDGEGNLWTWSRAEGRVEVWAASGEKQSEARVGRVEALDVDGRWGVAALRQDGRELTIQPFGDAPRRSLPLPEPAKGVAWLAADRVAVAPYGAAYRVALWDLAVAAPVRTLGEEKPVEEGIGAHFVRLVEMEPGGEGHYLYTLESFTGDFQVFRLADGLRVSHETLGNPRRQEFEEWLAESDRQARATGGTQISAVSFFHLALDPTGVAWVVKGCSDDRREAEIVRLPVEGEPQPLRVPTDCCSRSFTLWQESLIFHLGPEAPGRSCTDTRSTRLSWLEATPLSSQEPPKRFEHLRPGPFPAGKLGPGWWLLCSGGGDAGTACERRFLEEGGTFEVRPAVGVAVTGSVVVGRKPVADARVAVVPAGLSSRRPFTVPLWLDPDRDELLRRVSTGEEGRFRVPPLAPGEYFLEIHLPRGRIAASDPFTVPSPQALRPAAEPPQGFEPVFELGEILFPQGLSLEVWVTAAAGGPIPHARVGAGQGHRPEDAVFFETEADEEGTAVLAGLDPTLPMTLTCLAPGYATVRREVELTPGEDLHLPPIQLLPGSEIEGRVVAAETGEPVSGAVITVTDPPGGGSTVSGEEGRFRLQTGTAEALELSVEAEGYARSVEELSPQSLGGREPLRLTVSRGGRIEVLAWDEQGGPCVGCAVSVQRAGASGGLRTAADGRAISALLAPGRYPVTLVREQGLGSVVKVSGGDDVRWAEVRAGRTVTVRFGEPRQEVVVHFEPPPPPGWRLEVRGRQSAEILERRDDGGYSVRRKPGEAVELFLLGPPGSPTRVAQGSLSGDFDAPRRVLDLPQGGVHGVLLRGEEPAAAEPLRLFAAEGGLQAVVSTAADGSFFIPFVLPGTYTLAAEGKVRQGFQHAAGRVEDLGPIELAPGESP